MIVDAEKQGGRGILFALGCLLLAMAGCGNKTTEEADPTSTVSLAGTTLRLAVVDDPELANAIQKLRGEWSAQTGSEFEIATLSVDEILAGDSLDVDAVICPSYCLGPLAEKKSIVPMPSTLLPKKTRRPDAARSEAESHWDGVFELLRLGEASWDSQVWAVPFGSPVMACYYRPDLLEKLGRQPPTTWAEYGELAELLSDGEHLGTAEPLGPGWGGLVLLARGAAYAKHPSNYSAFFDTETMEPLIASPAMVRALEELVEAAKFGPAEQLDFDPAGVREAFWQGRAGMALTWPSGATEITDAKDLPVRFCELPGSTIVYNLGNDQWESRAEDASRVPLLATSGRIGVATANQPEAAFELLFWLSGEQNGPQVSGAHDAMTMFRKSHLSAPRRWCESPVSSSAASEYAGVIEATSLRSEWLIAPRIPGRAAYLAALDEAVRQAVSGEKPPAEALEEAAGQWRAITEKLGVESQKTAYLHSLGL